MKQTELAQISEQIMELREIALINIAVMVVLFAVLLYTIIRNDDRI